MKIGLRIASLEVATWLLIILVAAQICQAKDRISIISDPPGVIVEIDGITVGRTPYQFEVPGGYLHGTKSVFGSLLRQQMHVRLVLDGYLPVDGDLARGPMPWIALNGVYHGDYWLLKMANFNFSLQKAATAFTGNVQVTGAALESIALRPTLPTEEIVRNASPSVLLLRGSEGSGSGFVVTDSGVAVTNAHVASGQKTLVATTLNGQSFNAQVQYIDQNIDVAPLKLEGVNFSHLTIADSSIVQPGSSVLAIGSPSQGLQNTVTKGIVSAIGPLPNEPGFWIQTDTAINPGNSGGPRLNSSGEVIGITTQKRFQSSDRRPLQGIGFALSSGDLLGVLRRFYPNMSTPPHSPSAPSNGLASVAVSADAESADIYVDDKFAGNTPSTLTIPSGTHTVRVEAANRAVWTREIELYRDSNVNLKATLATALAVPRTELATTVTSPSNHSVESAPPAERRIQPQVVDAVMPVHQTVPDVLLANGGAIPNHQTMNVKGSSGDVAPTPESKEAKSNWSTSEVESAEPGVATITVASSPAGADIFIDSAGRGRTPSSLALSPGKHSIQIVLDGYKDQVGEILPRTGYKLTIDVIMQK
jgi:S1-C subfamily serine protease